MVKYDVGLNKYDPHRVAESYKNAIVEYRKARREYKSLERQKDEKEKQRYLFYKFESLEKHGVEDAKAKARTDEQVIAYNQLMEEKEKELDESFAELERCIWKKDLMLDANATARKEMELTRMET
jgi:hypothetical protein|tara:strand:- start:1331 stop:1705 length:375 start_codon:yes stop_codon:yes gene_type:complete